MHIKPITGDLTPTVASVSDCTPAEAARAADAVAHPAGLPAAERVRLARIGNRAVLAAACNQLLLRAGAPAQRLVA